MNKKGFGVIYILIGTLVLLGVLGGGYYFAKSSFLKIQPSLAPKACTEEAKQCSDGSYVGREGPNCEFKECDVSPAPNATGETANWKTYTNSKFNYSIKYPPSWVIGEDKTIVYLRPPEYQHKYEGISITVRAADTPVNPVFKEYETIRTIVVDGEAVKVLRAKNLASEQYLTGIKRDDFYLKFSFGFGLNRKYDSIFDQILSTLKFSDQELIKTDSKACSQDSDCALLACSGCFNAGWVKSAPPDLACLQYSGYSCQCRENKCTEIK